MFHFVENKVNYESNDYHSPSAPPSTHLQKFEHEKKNVNSIDPSILRAILSNMFLP